MKLFTFHIALFFVWQTNAQGVRVENGFLNDSVKVGQPVQFYLTARYPAHLDIIFPDSTYNFSPFELLQKKYFTTRTVNQISYDSAVYELTTFEIGEKFTLSLPVFLVRAADTTKYYALADTIALQHLVKATPPDTIPLQKLPLKTNTQQQELPIHFNYVIAGFIIMVLAAVLLLCWVLFGKRIKAYFTARRLKKNYARFSAEFDNLLQQLHQQFRTATAEAATALWKKYVESLTGKPLTRLTTKEIYEMLKNDSIHDALRQIDRSIYGFEHRVTEPLESLKQQASRLFHEKLQQVEHGRVA